VFVTGHNYRTTRLRHQCSIISEIGPLPSTGWPGVKPKDTKDAAPPLCPERHGVAEAGCPLSVHLLARVPG